MAFLEIRNVGFPTNLAGDALIATAGDIFRCGQMSDKGYDFNSVAGSTHVSNLEGSVAGEQWATIVALAVDSQGVIPVQYNYLRVNCSVAGAYAGDVLKIAGKVL